MSIFPVFRTRMSYWNSSPLAKWIYKKTNIKKPPFATLEGWDEWDEKTMRAHPLAYWVVEKCFNKIQNVVMYPADLYHSIDAYVSNRFIDKVHYIKTGLEPGEWYELDTRLLHGAFNLLVDYIEVSKAYSYQIWTLDYKNKQRHRSREHGLAHLDWEMNLLDEDGKHFSGQALVAQEAYALYIWWKDERLDIGDAWNKFYDENKKPDGKADYNKIWALEEEHHKKDTEMLTRLVKIRKSLW